MRFIFFSILFLFYILSSSICYSQKFSDEGILGNSLPGTWRPFNDKSVWNTPIPKNPTIHPLSEIIIDNMAKERSYLSFVKEYQTPIWVVDSNKMKLVKIRSSYIFDWWDKNRDGISDIGVPITPEMWGEPTEDGQIVIVDPFKNIMWDISTYHWRKIKNKLIPYCTTLDVWNLNGSGVCNPPDNTNWVYRGGRGSGFPGIAGIIRPEEIEFGEIKHALIFTYNKIRKIGDCNIYLPPACRSDGKFEELHYPIMGMRFQLNPDLTEKDFKKWGLTKETIIIAKALQKYGMFLGVSGGPIKLIPQLLAPSSEESNKIWEKKFPNLFKSIQKIPIKEFRIIYTGKPKIRCWTGDK